MESFSFLKYLRGGVVAGAQRAPVAATTIAASACEAGGGGGGGACSAGDVEDDASFFDLEFAVPGDESAASDAEEEQVELNFAMAGEDVAPGGGEVVAVDAVDAAADVETGEAKDGAEEAEAAEVAPASAPPLASLLRPATKFRVLLLKLRRRRTPRRRRRGGEGGGRRTAAVEGPGLLDPGLIRGCSIRRWREPARKA